MLTRKKSDNKTFLFTRHFNYTIRYLLYILIVVINYLFNPITLQELFLQILSLYVHQTVFLHNVLTPE